MKEKILVEGKYPVKKYRKMLDKQSGIPSLPGMMVHEPDDTFIEKLQEARRKDNGARAEYKAINILVDGMVELVPTIIYSSVKE